MLPKKKKESEISKADIEIHNNKTISSKSTSKPVNLRPYETGSKQQYRNAISVKKGISTVYNITFN